jgi:CBS domain-containing protein
MEVRQLMVRDVVTLEVGTTLDIVDDVMTLKRIRHLPVMENGVLVGLVTQRDLFRAGISSILEFRKHAVKEWLAQIQVREVMTQKLVTIGADAPVEDAVALMIDRKIGCLPVVADGKLVGLLSETDCLRYLRRILEIADVKRRVVAEEAVVDLT